jgi:hypothetical protein
MLARLLGRRLKAMCKASVSSLDVLHPAGTGVAHAVAAVGLTWGIRMLARAGADLNARDSSGATPLHWAAARGREQAVVALLCAGANPTLTAQLGPRPAAFTPADAALAWHHRGISAFLSEAALSRSVASLELNTTSESEAQTARLKPWRLPLVRRPEAVLGGKRAAEPVTSGVDESEVEAAKVSLAAEEAAARIQAAFRGHRRRKLHAIWGSAPPTSVAAARGLPRKRATSVDMTSELLERERLAQQVLQEEALAERAGGHSQSVLSLHGRLQRLQAAVRAQHAATHAGGTALLAELRRKRTVRPTARADEAEEASGEDDEEEDEEEEDEEPVVVKHQAPPAVVVDDEELVDDEARMMAATLRVQAIVRSHRARAQYLRLKRAALLQLGEHARKRAAATCSGVTDSDV